MELLKGLKTNSCKPIQVIAIKSSPESLNEFYHSALSNFAKFDYCKTEARGFELRHGVENFIAAEAETIQ